MQNGYCPYIVIVEIDRLEALIDNVIYGFDAQLVRCELDFNWHLILQVRCCTLDLLARQPLSARTKKVLMQKFLT